MKSEALPSLRSVVVSPPHETDDMVHLASKEDFITLMRSLDLDSLTVSPEGHLMLPGDGVTFALAPSGTISPDLVLSQPLVYALSMLAPSALNVAHGRSAYGSDQRESPLEFIANPPSRFVEFVESFGDAEFNFLYRNEDYFAYMATLTDSGEMVDACLVKIFRGHKSRYLEEILEQYGITVVDDVIIYHDAFFHPMARRCQTSMWAAKALTQFCGFRFF